MSILIIIIILAFAFDFINGFHDTANAIATCVSTRALSLKTAIFMSALISSIVWNLITWYFGIPSSSSHALIGSPLIALLLGFFMFSLFKILFKQVNRGEANHMFRRF